MTTDIHPTDDRLDSVLADYFQRLDAGEAVSPTSLLAANAELADQLREFFDAASFVEGLAGPTASEQTQMLGVHDTARNSLLGETIVSSIQQSPTRAAAKEGKFPQHFARYEIVRLLGQGAMGAVYLAYDPSLRRQIALKIPKFNADESPDMSERFLREARSAATLRHANICPVYDVGRVDGVHYITMAYIEGRTLAEELRAGRTFAPREIATIVRKLALAMTKAHSAGVVHRDLKPGNIMLDPDGEPILMDFGLAYHEETDELRLTKSGMIVGSPAYMSPEQIDGDPTKIGPASDIYSLGVVLYEMITGKLPFQGTMMSVIGQIANKEPTPVGHWRPELADSPLERLCRKLLAKRPEERPQSMQDVAAALDYVLSGLGHERETSKSVLTAQSPPLPLVPSSTPTPKPEPRTPSPEPRPVTYPASLAQERTERAKMFLATTLILAALLGLFGALAGIVYVATNQGTLEITSYVDDGIQIEVARQDGTIKVIDMVTGTEVRRLPLGDYTIKVKGRGDVVLDSVGFTIKRGGKVVVQANQMAGATMPPVNTAAVPTIERPADPPIVPEWRLPGPKPVSRMIDHSSSVRAVAFEPDGKHFISAGWDHTIIRWRRSEGSSAGMTNTNGHAIYRAKFLKSGRLVTSGYDGSIRTWDIETNREVGKLADVVQPITAMAVAASEKFVLGGSWDKKLRLWSLEESGAAREFSSRELSTDAGMIWDIALSPDDKQAAAAGFEGPVVLWDVEKGEPIAELGKHEGGALAVTYLDDGKKLLSAGRDGAIKLWDVAERKLLREQDFGDLWIESLGASPDGKYVLVGLSARDNVEADKTNAAAGQCLLFNLQTWNVDARLSTGLPCVYAAAFSPDGRDIVTGSGGQGNTGGGSVCFWRLEHVLRGETSPAATQNGPPLAATEIQRLRGHDEYVLTVAYARGEKILASAGADRAVVLWNPETGESRATPKLHTDHVRQIAFSSDYTRFLTAGNDRVLRLWNTDTLAVEKTLVGHKEHVSSVVFLPDGKRAISGSDDKSIILWDLDKPEPRFTAILHKGVVSCLALSPDGKTLASAGGDNHVILSEVHDNNLVPKHTLTGHVGEIRGLAFTPDGQFVISGSRDSTVRFWNAVDGKFVKAISPEIGVVYAVAVSPDGKWLAVGGGNWEKGTVKLYDILTSQKLAEITAFKGFVHSLAFTPDSQKLAAGSADKAVTVWKLEEIATSPIASVQSLTETAKLAGHSDVIDSLAYSRDGKYLFSGGGEKRLLQWDLATGQVLRKIPAGDFVTGVVPHPDGKHVFTSSYRGPITMWELESGQPVRKLEGHTNQVFALAITPQGDRLLSGGRDGLTRLWDTATGEPIRSFDSGYCDAVALSADGKVAAHDTATGIDVWDVATGDFKISINRGGSALAALAFTPDGKHLIGGNHEGLIQAWAIDTGKETLHVPTHNTMVRSLVVAPNGRHFISGNNDKSLRMFEWPSGREVARIDSTTFCTRVLALSPDGRTLASGGGMIVEQDAGGKWIPRKDGDYAVRLWRLPTLPDAPPLQVKLAPAPTGSEPEFKHVAALRGHGGPIFAVAAGADGLSALTASDDYFVRLWDLPGRKQIREFKSDGAMRCVAISPDGTRLAWSGGQKDIVVWDLKENKELKTLTGHSHWVYSLQFTKDAKRLLSISRDKTVQLWDLATGESTLTLETINRQDIVACLSPDETKILASSDNWYTLSLWNVADGQLLTRLHGHGPEGVYAAAFSPDGAQIATADGKGAIHLRDATTGEPRVSFLGHVGRVTGLAFTPDSKHLVTGGFDGTLCLRDAQTGALVARSVAKTQITNHIAILPGGKQVLTAGGWYMNERDEFQLPGDFDVHVWELPALTAEAPLHEPKTISDIMRAGFQRPETSGRKAFLGTATADDLKALRQFAVELTQQKPKLGTAEEWKTRTDELVVAIDASIAGQEGAVNRLRKAVSCLDCHKAHRPASANAPAAEKGENSQE